MRLLMIKLAMAAHPVMAAGGTSGTPGISGTANSCGGATTGCFGAQEITNVVKGANALSGILGLLILLSVVVEAFIIFKALLDHRKGGQMGKALHRVGFGFLLIICLSGVTAIAVDGMNFVPQVINSLFHMVGSTLNSTANGTTSTGG